MPDNESTIAVTQPRRASVELAHFIGMDAGAMLEVIRAQCFRPKANEVVTDAQVAAFVSIAVEMKVNPLLPGMLYAFPIQGGGIVPMMGPDGVFKKLSENASVDSWEVVVYPEDAKLPPTHAVAKLWRKGIERPLSYTAHLSEWKVASNPNWNSRPRHMLHIRALKQVARQVIHGMPFDEDERQIMHEIDVTPPAEQPKRDQAPPKAATTGVAGAGEEKKKRGNAKPAGNVVDGDFSMAEKPKEPATTLGDKETKTFVCRVLSFSASMIKSGGVDHPSVKATLDGDFKGNVIHLGGATAAGGKDGIELHPNPAYQLDKPVAITLVGKARKPAIVEGKEVAQHNAILVEAIKLAEVAAPAAPPAETAPAPEPGENVD